ncbi:TIGR01777 family oxidoreductase [Amphritea balenae]|nr:TIGR01777 family oxidoreductase [Amphritea balenae]GGK69774.1 epimerase [Amphritea balenae]
MMRVLISGATGFIGRYLVPRLIEYTHEPVVWARSKSKAEKLFGAVRVIGDLSEIGNDEQIDAIINLAGAGIAEQRWSVARKRYLVDSRLDTTWALNGLVERLDVKPEVYISGSAVGYYGCQDDDRLLDEEAEVEQGFTHQLCAEWEQVALLNRAKGVRVCLIRSGVVLGEGGALAKMLPPFRLGLGGPVASGKQWLSWIHIDDEVEIICMMLTHTHFSGAYNLTSPNAATNADFSQALAGVLSRPAWFRVPAGVIRLMLGEGSELLVRGQRVYPQRLLDAGYKFAFDDLRTALKQILEPDD